MNGRSARNPYFPARLGASGDRRGFTVVELLIVIGIVIAILSTVLVGLAAANRRAQIANTEFLMDSMVSAVARFKADTGYLPPTLGVPNIVNSGAPSTAFGTLGWARDLVDPPALAASAGGNYWDAWSNADRTALQRYSSVTSMPEYLLGFGDRSEDGYGMILGAGGALPAAGSPGSREQPTLGIRNPGRDGVWGAKLNPRPGNNGNGLFASRNLASANAAGNNDSSGYLKGKSLGPYLELKDDNRIGALTGFAADGTPQVAKPGEINNFDLAPKVILDYFGKPIIYYRRGYVNQDPRTTNDAWTLGDVVALRPSRFGEGDALNAMPDGNNDGSASREMKSAGFALLSFGPDQRVNWDVRADTAGFNADNIVRSGQ
ncbi:MAG: type II secretion system protein [Phycisphaerae bacterium]|nr:type II secretion system protein [Phycisphaerae bacterium]